MYKRLTNYLSKNKILSNKQFGFRPNHSASDAIVTFIKDIISDKEKNLQSSSIPGPLQGISYNWSWNIII